jgi:hypothetical protein
MKEEWIVLGIGCFTAVIFYYFFSYDGAILEPLDELIKYIACLNFAIIPLLIYITNKHIIKKRGLKNE